MTTTITAAHVQTVTLHIQENIPSHPTRDTDPYYHFFNEARARMKRQGLLKCWMCGTTERIELHHNIVEFSLATGVDIAKFAQLYPEFGVIDDDTFERFIEGEGNLTPLCKLHHTGVLGIHTLNYPQWQAMRFWKRELAPPEQLVVKGGMATVENHEEA